LSAVQTPLAEMVNCYVTCPSDEIANEIAEVLVMDDYAESVNILPGIKSIYKEGGKTRTDNNQVLCVIKTTRD
jgi:uncharacterized protein involved in tolerance to divalent cations